MRPVKHLLSSAAVGGIFYLYSNSFFSSSICFLSGVLIDLDHFIDFYLNYKRWPLNLQEFCSNCLEFKFGRLYVFLHSLELIAFVWLLIIILKMNLIWVAVATGITLHIILDIAGNKVEPFSYFLIYRFKKRFEAKLLFKDAAP